MQHGARRRRGSLVVAALAALALAACGGADEGGATAAAGSLSFVDDGGVRVTLAAAPQRVVALLPSVTDLLIDLGLEGRIVGTDDFSLPPTLAGVASVGGSGFIFNIEAIAVLEPDLLLVAAGGTDQVVQQSRTLGLPTAVLDFPTSLAVVLEQLRFLGGIFDVEERAAAVVADLEERLARVRAAVAGRPPVRVYLEVDQSTPTRPFTVGPGSLHDEVLTLAGGANIFAAAASPFPQVNWEAIIAADPEVILLLNSQEFAGELTFNPVAAAEVAARRGWAQIGAVRRGLIVSLPPDLFSVGTALVEAVERLAEVLEEARASAAAAGGAEAA